MNHPLKPLRDWRKILRVIGYLAVRPKDIYRYCRYGAFTRRTPLELGMPWWSFGAVDYLDARLRSNLEVFEYGSGGSTIFIGSRVRSLTCVEDDNGWAHLVTKAIEERRLKGISVLHKPFDFWNTRDFGESDYLRSLSESSFDIIVVDGREWSEPVRDLCFWRAEDHIKPGGLIVLDDSWRYPQVKSRNRSLRWKEFKGVGYCRFGVTSTSIFEY